MNSVIQIVDDLYSMREEIVLVKYYIVRELMVVDMFVDINACSYDVYILNQNRKRINEGQTDLLSWDWLLN